MNPTSPEQQTESQAAEPAKDGTQAIPAQVLLIDLDNCPNQIEKLSLHIEEFTRVIVSYGGTDPKVPFSLLSLLATPIHEKRLEIVQVEQGKNAADFALTFHAGLLVNELPPNAEFTILSDDTGLDHAVHLLQDKERKAIRRSGKDQSANVEPKSRTTKAKSRKQAKSRETPSSDDSQINEAADKLSKNLRKLDRKKKPKSKESLLNHIGSHFKGNKELADNRESILDALVKQGTIKLEGNKVKYS